MRKEIKHDCPTGMVWSPEKGKCIQPDLETQEIVDGDAYPERRNHSASNLDFSKRMKKGVRQ